jgi:hypothetical protein
MAEIPHSVANRGMNLCATFLSCLIPVLNLTVKGISPNILFIPTRILPSCPGRSKTGKVDTVSHRMRTFLGKQIYLRADPAPRWKTKSIGQPRLISTKSNPEPSRSLQYSLTISAAGTMYPCFPPQSWIPKFFSEGCLRVSDHSCLAPFTIAFPMAISPQVISAP